MFNHSRRHNREVGKQNWEQIVQYMSYKSRVELDRQLCGAVNIYLKMCGFPQSLSTFYRVVIKKMIPRWRMQMKALGGVATNGGEGNDKHPMNPGWWLSLMNPKAYIGLPMPMQAEPLILYLGTLRNQYQL